MTTAHPHGRTATAALPTVREEASAYAVADADMNMDKLTVSGVVRAPETANEVAKPRTMPRNTDGMDWERIHSMQDSDAPGARALNMPLLVAAATLAL